MIDISGDKNGHTAPKVGSWGSMNFIQRSGLLGSLPCYALSLFCNGRISTLFGLLGWTFLLLGWVAGNLWHFRHAVHFWWSMAFACAVHSALLPIYAILVNETKNAPGRSGKGYMYLAIGLVIVETLSLLFVLKKVALWLHHRTHQPLHSDGGN